MKLIFAGVVTMSVVVYVLSIFEWGCNNRKSPITKEHKKLFKNLL